uniref:Arginine kinase n=1 Tax=Haptolina ericina TaxID=156174 RepID=A0A7S3AEH5_9EUKA
MSVEEVANKTAAVSIGDAAPEAEELFKKVEKIRVDEPGNRCTKYLSKEYYNSLTPADRSAFWKCVRTGVDNPDSGLGCYAMKPDDYTKFKPFFGQVIGDYHKDDKSCTLKHVTDWDASGVGEGGVLDLQKLGLEEELSMRVRVGRNLAKFNLPGAMDKDERILFEKTMLGAFKALIGMQGYGGKVYSITPDFGADPNPNKISDADYNDLVARHVMFKDMDADPYLKSAGISSDWPYGRGCWMSDDGKKIIWFGEEDQLRIMVMKKGFLINEVFDELKTMLDVVEKIDGIEFAKDEQYGYVTSCPSNLGTGMRASVHVKVPKLTADGTDKGAKAVAGPLGLSVRGTGGEHTPIGADGTVDISPRARLFIKEAEIIQALYNGLKLLLEAEAKA